MDQNELQSALQEATEIATAAAKQAATTFVSANTVQVPAAWVGAFAGHIGAMAAADHLARRAQAAAAVKTTEPKE